MPSTTETLSKILEKPTDLDHVRSLVTPDVTYVQSSRSRTIRGKG